MASECTDGDHPNPLFVDENEIPTSDRKSAKVVKSDLEHPDGHLNLETKFSMTGAWVIKKEDLKVGMAILFVKNDKSQKTQEGVIAKIGDGESEPRVSVCVAGKQRKRTYVVNLVALILNACPICEKPAAHNVIECEQCKIWYCYDCVGFSKGHKIPARWVCSPCAD